MNKIDIFKKYIEIFRKKDSVKNEKAINNFELILGLIL